MNKFKPTNIRRNTIEGEVLEWALEGAKSYWCTKEEAKIRGGKTYSSLYKRGAKQYHIINSEEVIEYIIYRLDEQLPSMRGAATNEGKMMSELRAAERAVNKLKEVVA